MHFDVIFTDAWQVRLDVEPRFLLHIQTKTLGQAGQGRERLIAGSALAVSNETDLRDIHTHFLSSPGSAHIA